MAAKEISTGNQTLDKWFGGTNFMPPATWYFGLLKAGDTELSGNGYARVPVTNNSTNFPAASGKLKAVAVAVTFPEAVGGDWDTALKLGIWDAASGNNLKFKTLLSAPVTVLEGIEYTIDAGKIIFTEL